MITGDIAIIVLGCLALILALIIPVLDSFEKLSKFISLRWSCVAIVILIMVGVVIDFNHLADDTRNIVLTGGLIVVGGFIVLRTLEKVLYNGWLKGLNLKGSVQKGDIIAKAELNTDNLTVIPPTMEKSTEEKPEEDKKDEKPLDCEAEKAVCEEKKEETEAKA